MTAPTLIQQAISVAARDLLRERRASEVAWVTVPFGAVALLLIPLAIDTDSLLLRRIGPGLFWIVVLLFGVLVSVRRTAIETPPQRDASALSGVDPVAGFAGKAAANVAMLLVFEAVIGALTVVLYDVPLDRWFVVVTVVLLAAVGLGTLGTLAASIAANIGAGVALIPLLVAPLAVPLLLGATQALDSLQPSGGILSWVILMLGVDIGLAVAGVLSARALLETR